MDNEIESYNFVFGGLTEEELNEPVRKVSDYESRLCAKFDRHEMYKDLECPVCFEPIKDTVAVMACLHRFCSDCFETCLRFGKKECPACRCPVNTRRETRRDKHFDELIKGICPSQDSSDVIMTDNIQSNGDTDTDTSATRTNVPNVITNNSSAIAKRMQEGMERQKMTRRELKRDSDRQFARKYWSEMVKLVPEKITLLARRKRNEILKDPTERSFGIKLCTKTTVQYSSILSNGIRQLTVSSKVLVDHICMYLSSELEEELSLSSSSFKILLFLGDNSESLPLDNDLTIFSILSEHDKKSIQSSLFDDLILYYQIKSFY